MAGEALVPLASAGPFLGINTTETDIFLPATKGISMLNGDCEIIPKSLIASPGRTQYVDFTSVFPLGLIAAVAQYDGGIAYTSLQVTPQINDVTVGSALGIALLVSTPVTQYVPTVSSRAVWLGSGAPLLYPVDASSCKWPFTQALVTTTNILGYVSSPGELGAFIDDFGLQTWVGGSLPSTQLHYYPPVEGITLGAGAGTNLVADTYFYAFTLVANYSAGQTKGQETSPTGTNQIYSITLGAPGAVTITNTNDGVSAPKFNGTFPRDPQVSYTTNIYRSSLTQPIWYLVGNTNLTGATTFLDNVPNGGVGGISGNAQLDFNRDPAPIKAFNDFGTIPSGVAYFSGAPLELHKQRLWVFAYVINGDTGYTPQLQLWYSNSGRAWEFDKINNVFLVDIGAKTVNAALTFPPGLVSSYVIPVDPYTYPFNVGIEMPIALKTLSSVLMMWTTRKMYIVYGDDPATFVFRKFADIGCMSRASVAYAATETGVGIFWLSENGVYWTDGSSVKHMSEDIRSIIDNLPISDRYNAVGFYTNHTYFISFPSVNQTWGFRTVTGQWHGPIGYSTLAVSNAIANPSPAGVTWPFSTKIVHMNSVIAARSQSVAILDDWFNPTFPDLDLGLPQTVVYTSGDQPAQNPHIMKEYTHLAITHKKQLAACSATVTVIVDNQTATQFSYTFDLTQGPTQIVTVSEAGLGNALRGFLAKITISFTTVPANPTSPIQIKAVTLYGKYGVTNMIPTNMGQ